MSERQMRLVNWAAIAGWLFVTGLIIGHLAAPNTAVALPGIASSTSPSPSYELYTASNSTNFTGGASRGIYVKTAGDIAVVDMDGTAVVFPSVPAGSLLPVVAKRINATSTTNTGSGEFIILH